MKESQYKKAFGAALSTIRKKRKLSQEDLAYRADVDRSYISELEHGKYHPSLSIVYRLCEVLEIKPSELLQQAEKSLKN